MMGILNPKMEKRHDPKMRDITKGIILEIHEGIQPKVRDIINPKMKGILRDLVKGIILEILKVTIIIMSNLKGSLSQFQELLLTLQENLVDGVKVFLKGTLVLILKGTLRALKNGMDRRGRRRRWNQVLGRSAGLFLSQVEFVRGGHPSRCGTRAGLGGLLMVWASTPRASVHRDIEELHVPALRSSCRRPSGRR